MRGGNAHPGAVVATGARAYDYGGKPFSFWKFCEKGLEGRKKVAFLRTLTGEGPLGHDGPIAGQSEGRPGHAGFEGEEPTCGHKLILMRQLMISN